MSALIALASVLGYVALTLFAARWRYQAIRPYTEPLACKFRHGPGDHYESCYHRSGLVDTRGEAVFFALLTGLVWPFILPARLVARFVAGGARQLPEELAVEIERLEAENDRLKRQQDGRQL